MDPRVMAPAVAMVAHAMAVRQRWPSRGKRGVLRRWRARYLIFGHAQEDGEAAAS